jgi:hypothetical protein
VTTADGPIRQRSLEILESTWLEGPGYCMPNPLVYPHQWLWDSCFHSIAWASLGRPDRGLREVRAALSGALPHGFVPHMRYSTPSPGRGPLADRSSFTQPPIYAHALLTVTTFGVNPDPADLAAAAAGLDWLWAHRMSADGLIFIVHPWESGSDDSPLWDSWSGRVHYDKQADRAYDRHLVEAARFDELGAAVGSAEFEVAPAAFNAFTAHAARCLARVGGDQRWEQRARTLAAAMDEHLWDDEQGLWLDLPLVGGGESSRFPTLDGVFGALVTADAGKAERALAQCTDPSRFGAGYGVAYVARDHPRYDPNSYWRGPAWPQLNYMAHLAAADRGLDAVRAQIAACSTAAAMQSGFAEFWNPETGAGLGAIPQGWATLACCYDLGR